MQDNLKSVGRYLIIIIGIIIILHGVVESSMNLYLYVSGIMQILYGLMLNDLHRTENYITELENSVNDTMKQVAEILGENNDH